jgi:hypothetical protein
MSSIVQLKRSALSGKVPGTGSLNLGELALNTYDGKIFFRRSGSTDTIQEVVTTNVVNTGSVTLTGTLNAGSIVGSITASNGVVSGSSQVIEILSSLNSYTSSIDIWSSSLATTGSNQFKADQNITGSLRVTETGSFGSLKVNDTLTINHGEAIISGSALVTSNLTILGAVNARQFNISVISSSVLFESGSSNFGNTSDDTHSFTGSVNITGSFLLNGQEVGGGTTSGSFTGSFTGDGSGLRGVVSDDIPRDGWDYNANSSASISDFNSVSDKYYIDFEQSQSTAVGTPVGLKGFLTNVSGSTQILPTLNSIDFVVGNNVVASIDANGITVTAAAGTVSGSSQLTSSYDSRYVLSGSITQTTWDNIASKPSGIVSGSSQLTASVLATTGSNTFRGTQTLSGSIIPATDNTYDLGSATYQWRDIYVSSGSLYIDGTKVLGSTGNELQITTDEGQSIKILEAGTDNIILQSADGDIQLKTSGGGNLLFDPTTGLIDVRGTLQIQDGYKITSSGGNGVVFGNNIVVSGSLESTGNINGINLTLFSSSIASTLSNQNSATSSYETKGRGIVSGSSQITYANISSIPSGIVSGSSQITISSTTGFTTYSSSVDSRIATEKGRVDAILLASDADKDSFAEIVSLINSVDTSNDSTFASFYTASVGRLNNLETTSASVNTSISNLNTYTASISTASLVTSITNLNTTTASLNTSVSNLNTFSGSSLTRLTALEVETSNLESFSSSALSRLSALEVEASNLESFTSSINTTIKTRLNAETIVSGSSQVIGILSSLNTYTGSNDTTNTAQNSRLTSIESVTGSYETKGRGIVSGSSQITFSGISSLPTLVSGSSQITLSSTTGYGSVLNQAVLTTSSPTFAGGTRVYTTTAADNDGTLIYENGNTGTGGITNAQLIGKSKYGTVQMLVWDSFGTRIGMRSVTNGGAGNIYFTTGADNVGMQLIGNNLTVTGTITENSSIRYKENVETIKYGLDKVLQMRGVTYDKKDNGVKEMGVIAEEIYEVLPEVVLKNEEGEIDSVSYGRITAVLIEAIKDLKKEIEELKANR